MAARLIVNADDFGLTRGVNRAVAELARAGALTSATLMATGSAFADAVAVTQSLPGFGVGCHVVLVDGLPLSDPAAVPSLLAADGRQMRSSLAQFAAAALLGQLDEGDIEREAEAQVRRVINAGIRPTHLDTHKHTHMFPRVLRPLLRVAERFNIAAIRNPFEQPWSRRQGRSSPLRRIQIRLLHLLEQSLQRQLAIRKGRLRTTDGAVGVAATGTLDEATMKALLTTLPPGTWELVCHPGYNDEDLDQAGTRLREQRDIERDALLQLIPALGRSDTVTELISFATLETAQQGSART